MANRLFFSFIIGLVGLAIAVFELFLESSLCYYSIDRISCYEYRVSFSYAIKTLLAYSFGFFLISFALGGFLRRSKPKKKRRL